MKNSLTFKLILIISVFFTYCGFGQKVDNATYFARFITGQKLMTGNGLPKDTLKAIKLFTDCAENGNMPFAMNKLGAIYYQGQGAKKDLKKAFYWFSKSVEKGDPIGMYGLGSMYKMGDGVPMDYATAYNYFKASAEKGFHGGMYGVAYFSFKGLGTKQSYTEAVKWLKKGAEMNSPQCIYMLGICYRNGYGVEQNDQEATRLLQTAASNNIPDAEKELKNKFPEVAGNHPENNTGKTTNTEKQKGQPENFKKLLKHQDNIALDGTWVGTRYFFDWSGEHIIKEDSLQVHLKQNGDKITGQWFENRKLVVNLNGIVVDGQIVFNGSDFTGWNVRMGRSYPMQFKVARFEAINADVNYLAGNVESYSPQTKEPGYPCYVVMSRILNKSAKIDTITTPVLAETKTEKVSVVPQKDETVAKSNENKNLNDIMADEALDYFKYKKRVMSAYPNPFKNEINITYKTEVNAKVFIYIYNASGALVIQKNLGTIQAGSYTEKLNLTSPAGQYIVRLLIDNESYSQIIIKQ